MSDSKKMTDTGLKTGGLRNNLIRLVTIPVLIMGIVVMIFSYYRGYRSVSKEVESGLRNIANAALYVYDGIYDSEIRFVEKNDLTYELDGVSAALASDPSYINYLKEKTGVDVTLFYYDIRLLTTITDASGKVMNGTVVSKKVVDVLFTSVKPVFYDDIMVGADNYYVCYIPVVKNDKCVGMVAAGRPTSFVKKAIFKSTMPLILITLLMIVLASLLGMGEARKLADVIGKEKSFLGQIADGNLRANLDADILKRDDELGEMGKFTVHVQRFIRDMIERDTLTKLYTRRIGETRLATTKQRLIDEGVKFQMVMGDIDHFKRFNDTYGHDCGDLVLQSVAGIFNRMLIGKGYAVRWGGEEFILIYENMTYDEAYEHLCQIREEIIHHIVEYKNEKLSITMTFGIVPGNDGELSDTIKQADNLLYVGKEGGRDRIVRLEDYDRLLAEANMVDPELEKKKRKEQKNKEVEAKAAAETNTGNDAGKPDTDEGTENKLDNDNVGKDSDKASDITGGGKKNTENKSSKNAESRKKKDGSATKPAGKNSGTKKQTGNSPKKTQTAKNNTSDGKPMSKAERAAARAAKAEEEKKARKEAMINNVMGVDAKTLSENNGRGAGGEVKELSVFEIAAMMPASSPAASGKSERTEGSEDKATEDKRTDMMAKMMGVSSEELIGSDDK